MFLSSPRCLYYRDESLEFSLTSLEIKSWLEIFVFGGNLKVIYLVQSGTTYCPRKVSKNVQIFSHDYSYLSFSTNEINLYLAVEKRQAKTWFILLFTTYSLTLILV